MVPAKKTKRTCSNGHRYYKSSDCPVCPVCEKERKPGADFLNQLSAPARRALERAGVNTLSKLASFTEAEVLSWHGIGPSSIPKLEAALKAQGLSFRKNHNSS